MKHLHNEKLCQIINRLHLNIICFGYANFGEEWRGRVLKPDFSRLYYIMEGESEITIKGEKTTLTKGNWYLIPAGHSFEFSCPEYAEQVYYHLKLQDNFETDVLNHFSTVVKLPCSSEDTALLADNVYSSDVVVGMKVYNKAHSVILSMIEQSDINLQPEKFSPCVEAAIEFIHANLSAKLTVDDVVSHSFVSKSTLTKKFQSELATSVMNYIYKALISRSKIMLMQNDLSISEISEALGFSDQFYFSKRFKKLCGVSPFKFKKLPHI